MYLSISLSLSLYPSISPSPLHPSTHPHEGELNFHPNITFLEIGFSKFTANQTAHPPPSSNSGYPIKQTSGEGLPRAPCVMGYSYQETDDCMTSKER